MEGEAFTGEVAVNEAAVDGGTEGTLNYGYFIVALSFLAMFVAMGIRGSFGTYVAGWEQTFSVNRVWVSAVSFTSLVVYGVSIVVAGKLADKIGPRKILAISMALIGSCLVCSYFATSIWHMIILYGLIGSIGFGFASNVTVSVAIVKWFKDRKGMMISIVIMGMAAGPMIFNPLNIYLIRAVGWKSVFVIYGLIFSVLFIPLFYFFYRDSPEGNIVNNKKGGSKVGSGLSSLSQMAKGAAASFTFYRHPITWVISGAYFICGFTDIGLIYTHLVPFGESRGYSISIISTTLMLYGAANIVGTMVVGYISDRVSNRKLAASLYAIRFFPLLALIFVKNPMWLLIFAVLYGSTDIATITPFTMMCSKIFGEKNIGSAFGMVSFFHQLGAAAGALIPGVLFSLSANYQSTLWLNTILLGLNVLLVLGIREHYRYAEDKQLELRTIHN